ncbi:MAG: TrkA family potassium uptake protein [Planctomycetes bacterium]|nr:TrkA family potassium uptake protein [Planctomycetota bacterium]
MKIIIVGAGVVGSRLASVCCDDGHAVVVIEPDHEAAEAVAEACDALVLNANITDADIMEQAGADEADSLIATTGDDAKNLMAIVLARDVEIASLVAVVNDKGHRHMFERFGVRVLLEPEDLIAHHLLKLAERELDSER